MSIDSIKDRMAAGYDKSFVRGAISIEEFVERDSVHGLTKITALTATYDIIIALGIQHVQFGIDPKAFYIEDPKDNKASRRIGDLVDAKDASSLLTDKEKAVFGGASADSIRKIYDMINKVPRYLLELLMCNQVKRLKLENIKNYFKSATIEVSNVDYILKFLRVASGSVGKLVEDDSLREVAILNPFVKYHIAYASGGQLIMKSVFGLGSYSKVFFTDDEVEAADKSSQAVWDIDLNSKIPSRAFIVSYAYLKASGILPDNWYQGEKYWSEAPAGLRKGFLAVFKKITEFMSEVDKLDEAKTIEELISRIPKHLRVD